MEQSGAVQVNDFCRSRTNLLEGDIELARRELDDERQHLLRAGLCAVLASLREQIDLWSLIFDILSKMPLRASIFILSITGFSGIIFAFRIARDILCFTIQLINNSDGDDDVIIS